MKFLGIIPSRYASSRFPGKPLADLCGKPLIRRVYEQVYNLLDEVVVATDDERIFRAIEDFGGKVVMTSPDHQSGTDRCYEAYTKINGDFDVVINIQGDEPFINPKQIGLLKACFSDPQTQIATLVKPFPANADFETLFNPNTPKVVLNVKQQAIYFSRSVIPYIRGKQHEDWLKSNVFYKHIGIYAYKSEVLKEIAALPQTPLEKAESLEQLRWIENDYTIKVGITDEETIGIDTPEDLAKAVLKISTESRLV
ncbi:3-deoxy-manno-octulosonate cytidylyltransferase [Bacteroidia bacterium]|nr:3-deoxy-manno-octulosonate cytidylyltransferase [Bacteroidia bacterium]